jgi:hypothetical protein
MGGVRKKDKAHKMTPECMITKDVANMVSQMVHDHIVEDFDNAQHQRDMIEEEMEYMWKLLQQFKEA